MNHNEKKEILKKLDEKEFRQDLIIPLLSKMGYIAPVEYHGTNEKGKDIICFEYDKLGEQRFLAIVAKTGDLTGSASSNAGLMNVVTQISQAFDSPYEELFNMRQVNINEVWVMTTGKIVAGAEESVINTLRKTNLDKQIRFIRDDRLVQLIDKHFNTYWNSTSETKESVIIQRDRLIKFVENLLRSNNVEHATIEAVKSSVLYSDFSPIMTTTIDGLHISNVSPFSIEFGKIDSEFDDYIYSYTYGITKDEFAEAKKYLSRSFYDIEDTIEHANRISKMTNPEEFVNESLDNLSREYPFYRSYGDASKFLDKISMLQEGLQDLIQFKKYLSHLGKLDWVKKMANSIVKLESDISNIIENCNEDELILNFSIRQIDDEEQVVIEFDSASKNISFGTKHKFIDKTSRYNRNKDGRIETSAIINSALHNFRRFIENEIHYNEYNWEENPKDI